MFRYKLLDTTVSLDTKDPNDIVEIEIDGTLDAILRPIVSNAFGYYGHLLGDSCSPRDLDVAMYQEALKVFKPKLIEGAEILESNVFPEFPDGAVS